MKEITIKAENLTKYYDGLLAVDKVNLDIRKGDFFGFLGPNGAGKTTTIKMLAGLTSISSGSVTVFGKELNKNLNYIKRRIGVVEDTSNLFMDLTVFNNLLFKAKMFGVPKKTAKKRIEEYISDFKLTSKINTKFLFLSKGQKRIISILSSIIHHPSIIFLDEPTIGLDINARNTVYNFLRTLNKNNITIFLTSHYFEEIELLCDSIAVINKGRIIYNGKMTQIKKLFPSDKVLVITFNEKLDKFPVAKYFKYFKTNNNSLYLQNINTTEILEGANRFVKDTNLKIVEINTEGNKLEDLFMELIKRDK